MSKENSTGLSSDEKKAINNEGFEGQAAILVGRKEEMPNLVERLEKEGRAADLETYIRMHKEIIVPSDERKSLRGRMIHQYEKGMAYLYTSEFHDPDGCQKVTFIDSNNNLAQVLVDTRKIESFRYEDLSNKDRVCYIIGEELKKMGFNVLVAGKYATVRDGIYKEKVGFGDGQEMSKGDIIADWDNDMGVYQKKLEAQAKTKQNREFNF